MSIRARFLSLWLSTGRVITDLSVITHITYIHTLQN